MRLSLRLLAALASALLWARAPALAEEREVAIATGGPLGVYYVLGRAICHALRQDALTTEAAAGEDLHCAAQSSPGSLANIEALRAGKVQFAVVQSDWQHQAYTGEGRFADKTFKDMRSVFSAHAEPFQLVVSKDSKIAGLTDLKGMRVNIGNPGSGQRATFDVLLEAMGAGADFLGAAEAIDSTEQANALCKGEIDAYGITVGLPNIGIMQATTMCGARLVPVTGPAVDKLLAERPYYRPASVPKGSYPTVEEDIPTFAVTATVVTRADVDAELVYRVTRAVFEHLQVWRNLHRAFSGLKPEAMASTGLTAPLHDGALKYFKEAGIAAGADKAGEQRP